MLGHLEHRRLNSVYSQAALTVFAKLSDAKLSQLSSEEDDVSMEISFIYPTFFKSFTLRAFCCKEKWQHCWVACFLQHRTTKDIFLSLVHLHIAIPGPTEKERDWQWLTPHQSTQVKFWERITPEEHFNDIYQFIQTSAVLLFPSHPIILSISIIFRSTEFNASSQNPTSFFFSDWTVLLKGDFESARWQSKFSPSAKNQANEVFLCRLWALHCDANFPNYKNWAGPVL